MSADWKNNWAYLSGLLFFISEVNVCDLFSSQRLSGSATRN